MSDFKPVPGVNAPDLRDAVSVRGEAENTVAESNDLPVSTYDDYKTWCDKVRQEWDIN